MTRLRALLVLLAIAGCAPVRDAPSTAVTARPALWKLADTDTTIWLFGTIHALPRDQVWRWPAVETAIGQSGTLVLETILDEDPRAIVTLLTRIGRGEGLPPLAERVPPARRARLAELIEASGLPAQALDQMKTWAAAVVLTGPAMKDVGVTLGEDKGVEAQLTETFRAAGKPVEGLETVAEQLGFFDVLPESAQRDFLAALLDPPKKGGQNYRRLVKAWSRGDTAAIARAFDRDPKFTPETREVLIRQRNRAWADALAKKLEEPGTILVAVGAGHLVGKDAVQSLLEAKGLRVQRLR